jgi:hypothetical protein
LQLLCVAGVSAAPTVEGFDLVSSARVDRTTFDYSYRLRLRGDSTNYTSATITVATKSIVSGSSVVKGVVALGQVDAGKFFQSTDVFVVRHNRLGAFDPRILTFSFSGTQAPNPVGSARIGAVFFAENRGRPGHEGTFKIQGKDPSAGASLWIAADVFDSPNSVSYRLRSTSGALFAQGSMHPFFGPRYMAEISLPNAPFHLEIEANSSVGQTSRWATAKPFELAPFDLRLSPQSAAMRPGQAIALDVVISSATAAGEHAVSLSLPAGFVAQTTSWVVHLTPGGTTTVRTLITAPLTPERMALSTLVAHVKAPGAYSKIWTSDVVVLVE